jgi:hypothetical protein
VTYLGKTRIESGRGVRSLPRPARRGHHRNPGDLQSR